VRHDGEELLNQVQVGLVEGDVDLVTTTTGSGQSYEKDSGR
jgi:hypothetical protein